MRTNPMADWKRFHPVISRVVKGFLRSNNRLPKSEELKSLGHGRLVHAAFRHHGGYSAVLKKLGYPVRSRGRRATRRSIWKTFAADADPIIAGYLKRKRRLPTQLDLIKGKHYWLTSAAGAYHGGLVRVYRRLGYDTSTLRNFWTWEEFAVMAKPLLLKEMARLERVPYWFELKSSPKLYRILMTSKRKFGGYRAVLKRLGLPRTTHHQKGTGFANWETYRRACQPVIAKFVRQHGRTPFVQEVRDLGWRRCITAARNFHGGYIMALRRMGFTPSPAQTPPAPRGWKLRELQLRCLRRHFPELLHLGIMPSSCRVMAACPGLYYHWYDSRKKWSDVAKGFGLADPRPGTRMVLYMKSILEALQFFETHRRWPISKECSATLRGFRWKQRTDWHQYCTRRELTKPILAILAARWQQHIQWCKRYCPEAYKPHLRIMNRLVIARNSLET